MATAALVLSIINLLLILIAFSSIGSVVRRIDRHEHAKCNHIRESEFWRNN
jgi:hypothetical protein